MTRLFFLMFFSVLTCSTLVFTDTVDSYAKESKAFGEAQINSLRGLFELKDKEDSSYTCMGQRIDKKELLSPEDRDKTMDLEQLAQSDSKSSASLSEWLNQSWDTKSEFEGSEELFSLSNLVVESPEKFSGVSVKDKEGVFERDQLEDCFESGTYQAFIEMNLEIKTSETTTEKEIDCCMGHFLSENFRNPREANQFREIKLHEFKQDFSICKESISSNVHRQGLGKSRLVEFFYKHKLGVKCACSVKTKGVVSSVKEEEVWRAEDELFYQNLKSNSNCKLLGETYLDHPENRNINGHSVFRQSWTKRLCYSCGVMESQSCKDLREKGGKLVSKICLKETPLSQCEQWKKTYDMGGKNKLDGIGIDSNFDKIWGMEGVFDDSYEKNRDFGEVLSTLAITSEAAHDLGDTLENVNFNTRVFSGQAFYCKKNKFENVLYDCCGTLSGGLVKLNFIDCTAKEKLLQQAKQEGRSVFVGKKKKFTLEGWTEKNCYCVFSTKLAKVVQEHARKKGTSHFSGEGLWGTLEEPDCSGLSIEELISLDFEEIDLSEVIGDYKSQHSQKQLANRLNEVVRALSKEELEKKVSHSFKPINSRQRI